MAIHTQPVQELNDFLSHHLAEIESKLNPALARTEQWLQYLSRDATLIHHEREWHALQNIFSRCFADLESAKHLASVDQLNTILQHQRSIERFIPDYFQHQLSDLTQQCEAGHPIQHQLHELRANPFFLTCCKGSLRKEADFLWQQSMNATAAEIVAQSRNLFLQLPREEMTQTKADLCPHYLSITAFFNQLNAFVIHDILSHTDINARTTALSYWINIAKALYEAGDFSSLRALTAAINSAPIHRLKKSSAGLSDEDWKTIKELEAFSSHAEWVNSEMTQRAQQQLPVIPYVGTYRTTLERAKARNDLLAKENVAQQLITLQQTHPSPTPNFTSWIAQWGQGHAANTQQLNMLLNTLFEKANHVEPKDSQQLPSTLLHYHPHCWLAKLRNETLVEFLLQEQLSFKPSITLQDIHELNAAAKQKFSDQEFKQLLQNAGLSLDDATIHSLNGANRQLYYRGLIENNALRYCIGNMIIHRTTLGESTTKHILTVNTLLQQGISENELDAALNKIGISLSPEELSTIIAESHQKRTAMHLPETEQLVACVRALLNSIKVNQFMHSPVQKQFENYLQLLQHHDDLSNLEKKALLLEFDTVIPGSGFQHSGFNPHLLPIHQLALHLQPLYLLRDSLCADHFYHQLLINEINAIEKIIERPHYQRLLKINAFIQQWKTEKGEPNEEWKQSIKAFAHPIPQQRFNAAHFIGKKLMEVKKQTRLTLEKISYQQLWDKFTQHFIPKISAFVERCRHVESCKLPFHELDSLIHDIQQIDTFAECDIVQQNLQRFTILHELQHALETIKNRCSDIKKQFNLCASFKQPQRQKSGAASHFRNLLDKIHFKDRLMFAQHLTSGIKPLEEITAKYPSFSLQPLAMIEKLQQIEQALTNKKKMLQENPAEPTVPASIRVPMISKQQNSPTSTTQHILKWGAMIAGGTAVGFVAAHAAPAVATVFALKAAATALGFKVSVGAAGAAAGACAGKYGEKALGKSLLSRSQLFRGKTMRIDHEKLKQDSTPNITP